MGKRSQFELCPQDAYATPAAWFSYQTYSCPICRFDVAAVRPEMPTSLAA